MLADPRALCQRFVLPLFDTASTQRKGGFTTTKGGLGEMDEIQTAWLQTHDLGSYADLIPHILSASYKCFKINIPSQPLKLWKMTVKTREWPTLGQQPVVKGLCTVTTIKMEGWKRRYVILTHSINEDGDMFLLFLCALVIRVHEIGR